MLTDLLERRAREALSSAGITVNGKKPWDMQVHDRRLFRRVLLNGTLGLGDAYMDGWWDSDQLDGFFKRAIEGGLDNRGTIRDILMKARMKFLNVQSGRGGNKVAEEHYDLTPELYESFLDPYNQYTCGYFDGTENLNEAQQKKLHMICEKLQLTKDDHVLDIGCGWGGFAKYAAEHYGARVTGITISKEQAKYAKEFTKGLPVSIRVQNYKKLHGKFSKVLVCGMIEHVGLHNYRGLMEKVHDVMDDEGLFLLHTIGGSESRSGADPWIERHIFPNSMIPSLTQLSEAAEGLLIPQHVQNIGPHYAKTLGAWHENFNRNWDSIKDGFDGRFKRMWDYYLLSCKGAFEAGKLQLWQIVHSKAGHPMEYLPRAA